MVTTLLIGLKPGSEATPLIDLAKSLAPPPAQLILASLVSVGTEENEQERLAIARSSIEALSTPLTDDGYAVQTYAQIIPGSAGAELGRLSDALGADLLFVGLSKRTRVGKALLGSDAQSALLGAVCPVVSVRVG